MQERDMKNTLNSEQQTAYKAIRESLANGSRYTTLTGYAGTGKTYLAGQLIRDMVGEGDDVYVCAPTHKAVQVLRRQMKEVGNIYTGTIHSFLGLRLYPDNRGGYELKPAPGRVVPLFCKVLVDEASMVGQREWKFIEEEASIQWVFIGDDAQLPPVNEDPSPIFDSETATLEQIVRQAKGNPIIELAWAVRTGEPYITRYFQEMGIKYCKQHKTFRREALRRIREANTAQDNRILAYRNSQVNRYNRYVRNNLYGVDAPRFVPGEWLMVNKTWVDDSGRMAVMNSEDVVIEDIREREKNVGLSTWKFWRLDVRNDRDQVVSIDVLHEEEQEKYSRELAEYKARALGGQHGFWKEFYSLMERFASVSYGYAMTVHKAQGSTFKRVFMDNRDIRCCKESDRRKLAYVAVTRPAEELFLLT